MLNGQSEIPWLQSATFSARRRRRRSCWLTALALAIPRLASAATNIQLTCGQAERPAGHPQAGFGAGTGNSAAPGSHLGQQSHERQTGPSFLDRNAIVGFGILTAAVWLTAVPPAFRSLARRPARDGQRRTQQAACGRHGGGRRKPRGLAGPGSEREAERPHPPTACYRRLPSACSALPS